MYDAMILSPALNALVNVIVRLSAVESGVISTLWYNDGWNCCFVNDNMDVNRDNEIKDIIAWMPLPDPIMKEVKND